MEKTEILQKIKHLDKLCEKLNCVFNNEIFDIEIKIGTLTKEGDNAGEVKDFIFYLGKKYPDSDTKLLPLPDDLYNVIQNYFVERFHEKQNLKKQLEQLNQTL